MANLDSRDLHAHRAKFTLITHEDYQRYGVLGRASWLEYTNKTYSLDVWIPEHLDPSAQVDIDFERWAGAEMSPLARRTPLRFHLRRIEGELYKYFLCGLNEPQKPLDLFVTVLPREAKASGRYVNLVATSVEFIGPPPTIEMHGHTYKLVG